MPGGQLDGLVTFTGVSSRDKSKGLSQSKPLLALKVVRKGSKDEKYLNLNCVASPRKLDDSNLMACQGKVTTKNSSSF